MFPDMPFGNMDSDKIEARKGLLETFLKVGGFARSRDFSRSRPPSHVSSVSATLCYVRDRHQRGDAGVSGAQHGRQDRLREEAVHRFTHRQGISSG